MNEHRAIVNRLLWMQETYGLNAHDRVLQKTPFSFDVSVWEFFWPLMTGATLVVARPEGHKDAAYLAKLIQQERITTIHFVPSMLEVFLNEPQAKHCESLKRVICSGEALSWDLKEKCQATLKAGLHNLYGPTEAAVDVTFWPCDEAIDRKVVPIGRPVANTRIYILDRYLQPVPIGVSGELYIAGIQVGRGYRQRPELTGEKFVPDPFSEIPGARMYRTGDLARHLPNGAIEYLGRLDDQVKIRGFRIELGEIEARIREQGEFSEATVVARDGAGGDKQLVAYVVPRDGHAANIADLRGFLKDRLPEYMVPSFFAELKALPLSPNGKLDRKALPEPREAGLLRRPREPVRPRSSTESRIAEIWSGILGIDDIGVTDDFFELGGHSLKLAQLASRLRNEFDAGLTVRDLFGLMTIEAQASRFLSKREDSRLEVTVPLPDLACEQGAFRGSFSQRQLWFLDQLIDCKELYNVCYSVKIEGTVDEQRLRNALETLCGRHAGLRSSFRSDEGSVIQHVDACGRVDLEVIDLSVASFCASESRCQAIIEEEARTAFDLAHAPLWRVRLVRLGACEHRLIVNHHHIITDGWSTVVFFRELDALYEADGDPSVAGCVSPCQYPVFSEWQTRNLAADAWRDKLDYWREQLKGHPSSFTLPIARRRDGEMTFRGNAHRFSLPQELVSMVTRLGHSEGATPFITLLAAFYVLLHRYSGQTDLVVGTPTANRSRVEFESTLGMLINMLALRVDLSGRPTFRELLRRVRRVVVEGFANQEVPFEHLVEQLHPERGGSYQPIFQILFVYENMEAIPTSLCGARAETVLLHNGTSKFDLSMILEDGPGGISGFVEYCTDLFDAGSIARLVDHYLVLLRGIAETPDLGISELPLLSPGERQQLLVEWNGTAVECAKSCVHELFEQQAARTPDAVAVVVENESLTYRELNRRANQLAHYLRRLGVGPEVLAGICVERSLDMVVGLLGILKAGGAYVPLDPAYPADRLSYMIADARAQVVIGTSRLRDRLPGVGHETVWLDELEPVIALESEDDFACGQSPDTLAYVMYTSGSTGRPKGVEVPHRGIVRLVQGADYCHFGPDEVILQLAPVSFDASTFEIWGSLLNGGRLVLYPEDKPSLDDIGPMIRQHGITTMWLTAGLFHLMVDERLEDLGGLRQLLAGGDVLSPGHVRRCLEAHPSLRLVNGYGPTENTTFTCCHTIVDPRTIDEHVPIGRPIANTSVYILDEQLCPVPIGVDGELYTGGDGLSRGYRNRPEWTAERFIPCPFGHDGTRLYRTGDRVRRLPDGAIQFLGRTDSQVKIRGFRIELGEIEARLREYPQIGDAIVVVREGAATDKLLVAYVVPREGQPVNVANIRLFLMDRLPAYMVPALFVALEAFPLSPNGKVDRKALPHPTDAVPEGVARKESQPRTETERILAAIWEELLDVRPIGIDEDFFELGGHSLKLAQLVARIDRQFKVKFPIAAAFAAPTVAAMAAAIVDRRPGRMPLFVPLQPAGHRPPLFIFPGVGAHPYGFAKLATLLGEDRPVYGAMAIGLDGSESPPEQVEEIAERYCREMMVIQPEGPWFVIGYSFGGLVVFEMARQMGAIGRTLGFVGLLDTAAPGYPKSVPLATRARLHWRFFAGLSLRGKVGYVLERFRSRTERLLPRMGVYSSQLPPEVARLKKATLGRCNRAMMKAYYAYRPQKIHCDLVVFRAATPPGWAATLFDDPNMGWESWTTGRVEAYEVPGTHLSVVREQANIAQIAAVIRSRLERNP